MAQDVESLYAGVKALVCVVRSNKVAQAEMDRRRGFQTLAMLLRRKKSLLNSHILHLAFSLVGTVDSGRETSAIPNRTAFQVSLQVFKLIAIIPSRYHFLRYKLLLIGIFWPMALVNNSCIFWLSRPHKRKIRVIL